MKKIGYILFGVALTTMTVGIATAGTVPLGITGNISAGGTFLDFGNYNSAPPYASPGGYASFLVNIVGPGVFLDNGVTQGETGMIQSLSSATFPPSTPFMTFSTGGSNLQLFATTVVPIPVTSPNCVDDAQGVQLCQTPTGVTGTLDLSGTLKGDTTHPGATETFLAVLTASDPGATFSTLTLPVDTTYEETVTVTVSSVIPEPATLLLMGLGLTGLGVIARRKLHRN